jgi:transposase
MGNMTNRTHAKGFLSFMKKLDRSTPKGKDLPVILDDHSAHKTAEITVWPQNTPHIRFHFAPRSLSWLKAFEGWAAQLKRRSLYRGALASIAALNNEIERYIEVRNRETAKPFKWT